MEMASTRRNILIITLALMTLGASVLRSQNAVYPPQKVSPPKIEPQIVLLTDSVVQSQWSHTLKLVNAPQTVALLNPGQCIRVGIYSTGDQRDAYLQNTKLSFRVLVADHSDAHPPSSLLESKQIKPEGGDFVAAALAAGGVEQPATTKSIASLGVSADPWCAPPNAADGTVTVEAEVESPSGHQSLQSSVIPIESFETGSKKSFKDIEELGTFTQTYYRQPNSARLFPALQFMAANQSDFSKAGQAEILAAFLSAALRSDPVASRDFQTRIEYQSPMIRAFGLLVLRAAGHDISSVLNTIGVSEQQKFLSLTPLQDPFDLAPTRQLFQHLDMMWAVFGATGQLKPVETIASMLGWRTDYEDFDKLRKSPDHPAALTPSIVRGVAYTAAGWSLGSFQKNDPLVADYIEYLRVSPNTPQSVKTELAGLSSNPAFSRAVSQ
jgi:hypothetical protein